MVVIIDYGLGNLRSVAGAVKKAGYDYQISGDPASIEKAEKLILPGVGAFGDGINNLGRSGIIEVLNRSVLERKTPILGICLGAQLMTRESFEFGHHKGLGWLDASVVRLDAAGLRVPHVGWNNLTQIRKNLLFEGITGQSLFYYVHSFCIQPIRQEIVIGECEYGTRFSAALCQDNIYATQFHPEKSQLSGLCLLKNFLSRS